MTSTSDFRLTLACFSLTLVLCGCGANPSIRYKDFATKKDGEEVGDVEGYSKFSLQTSAIRATITKQPADKTIAIKLASVPTSTDHRYGLRDSGSDLWVRTETKLKTRDNSELVEKLEVELFDNRKETIKEIGTLATTVLGFAAAPEPAGDMDQPSGPVEVVFDLPAKLAEARRTAFEERIPADTVAKDYQNWSARIQVKSVPSDAVARTGFDPTKHSSVFFYSACRDALIELVDDKATVRARASVRIADPNFVQTVALPRKGAIGMDSECGISVTSEAKAVTKDTVVLNEIIAQVKAVLDAKKKQGQNQGQAADGSQKDKNK